MFELDIPGKITGYRFSRAGPSAARPPLRHLFPTQLGIVILAVFTIASCGYRFSGGGELPGEVKRVFITIFNNRTSELGVENVLAAQLTDEFLSLGPKGVLVSERQTADAELSGVISSVVINTVTLRTQLSSAERRVSHHGGGPPYGNERQGPLAGRCAVGKSTLQGRSRQINDGCQQARGD